MAQHTNGESGRTAQLLWVNTILTALLLPLISFVGVRLWNQVDMNATRLGDIQSSIVVLKERQDNVLKTLPELQRDLDAVQKEIDTIKKDVEFHVRTTGGAYPPKNP
jgi:septal ring factor EnvC (AmiA/AmiB activator)